MTREEMASVCHDVAVGAVVEDVTAHLIAAAAELRKTCATCKHFRHENTKGWCREWSPPARVPHDGSGFCHRWETKS